MCVSIQAAMISSSQKGHNENIRKCDIDGQTFCVERDI